MSTPTKTSKTRKTSLKETNDVSTNNLSLLLRESEERMKCFFKEEIKSITDRLSNIENSISSIKIEAVRMDNKITMPSNFTLEEFNCTQILCTLFFV